MKNKKFALTLSLEENTELMNEIDSMIRERVKGIIREEAEKMIGGSITEEAKRVAEAKINNMESYEISNCFRTAIVNTLSWTGEMREITSKAAEMWCENHAENVFHRAMNDFIARRLSGVVEADVINVVVSALVNRNANPAQ